MGSRDTKTEHGGAKHAKGYWGSKEEAKLRSKKYRRKNDVKEAKIQLTEKEMN
jgi:hypothetical protein